MIRGRAPISLTEKKKKKKNVLNQKSKKYREPSFLLLRKKVAVKRKRGDKGPDRMTGITHTRSRSILDGV